MNKEYIDTSINQIVPVVNINESRTDYLWVPIAVVIAIMAFIGMLYAIDNNAAVWVTQKDLPPNLNSSKPVYSYFEPANASMTGVDKNDLVFTTTSTILIPTEATSQLKSILTKSKNTHSGSIEIDEKHLLSILGQE